MEKFLEEDKISVIVPVYNVERYLGQCVDSILRQTYRNLEIILVDDGSPDNSPEICDKYEKKDNRIKVLHKKNGGLASARNAGMDIATGKYIGFVDSDDMIAEDMYEVLYKNIIRSNAEIAVCYKTDILENIQIGEGIVEELNKTQALKKMVLGIEFGSHACDKLFKKKVLVSGVRFPEGKTYEDLYTIYQWINNSNRIILCKSNKYYYRPNLESITSAAFSKSNMNLIYGLENLGDFFKKNYGALVKYQKMALAKSSSALLRKMITSNSYDVQYISYLIKIIRKNIWVFLFSPYKITSKLFTIVAAINFTIAVKLYKFLQR
mgnify:CR=1 FL=1